MVFLYPLPNFDSTLVEDRRNDLGRKIRLCRRKGSPRTRADGMQRGLGLLAGTEHLAQYEAVAGVTFGSSQSTHAHIWSPLYRLLHVVPGWKRLHCPPLYSLT